MNWHARLSRWWNGPPPRPLPAEPLTQDEALDMLEDGKTVEEVLAEFERRLVQK